MNFEYMLISEWKDSTFELECDDALKRGWRPQGGVSVAIDAEGGILYSQSMMRQLKEKESV